MSRSAQWLLDVGNSRIKLALLGEQGARGEVSVVDHEDPAWLPGVLHALGRAQPGDTAWVASVAPAQRTGALLDGLRTAGFNVVHVATQACMGQLRIAYAQPSRLGVDRFLGLLAASERDDGPWLLVSAGSALTIDLLAADGSHHGGLIAPMPDDMRAALSRRFAQLDLPAGRVVDFAEDTAGAIASGANGAVAGLVERSLRKGREKLGMEVSLLASGGAASLLDDLDAPRRIAAPWLVLDGLASFIRLGGR